MYVAEEKMLEPKKQTAKAFSPPMWIWSFLSQNTMEVGRIALPPVQFLTGMLVTPIELKECLGEKISPRSPCPNNFEKHSNAVYSFFLLEQGRNEIGAAHTENIIQKVHENLRGEARFQQMMAQVKTKVDGMRKRQRNSES
jgi:hypothetical protein